MSLARNPDHIAIIDAPSVGASNGTGGWRPSSRSRRGAFAGLGLAGLLVASEALAAPATAPEPRLEVAVLSGPGLERPRAAALQLALGRRLAAARGLEWAAPERPDPTGSALARIEAGQAAFERLELQTAAQELEAGVLALGAAAPRHEALPGALFALGATALYDGRPADALGLFTAVAVSSPDFQPEGVPEHVQSRLERVRATLKERPTGALRVGVSPRAEVWVDGVRRGEAPIEVEGLADGVHLVRLSAPGYAPVARLVSVESEGSPALTEALEPLPPLPLTLTVAEAADPDLARGAALRLGVSHLVALRPVGADTLAGVWVFPEGTGSGARPLRIDGAAGSESVLADLILQHLAAAEAAPPPPSKGEGKPDDDGSLWLWTGLGAVVLGAVAGGIALSVAASDDGDPGPPPGNVAILGF